MNSLALDPDFLIDEVTGAEQESLWAAARAEHLAMYEAELATARHTLAERGILETWDAASVGNTYSLTWFSHGVCGAVRKTDQVYGMLIFDHSPRLYYDFQPERK